MNADNPNIVNTIRKIHSAPYFQNDLSGSFSNHEKQVVFYLEQDGFIRLPVSNTKKKDIEKTIEKMGLNTFLHQPLGSQNSPDFIVKLDNGIHICIECKSCKNSCFPVYNSGSVRDNYIYIFTSNKTNKTTLFMGQDIITKEQLDVFKETDLLIKDLLTEQNKKLKELDVHQRGWDYYSRRMINQQGCSSITNYFEHPDREKCEKNVMEYVKQQSQIPPTPPFEGHL